MYFFFVFDFEQHSFLCYEKYIWMFLCTFSGFGGYRAKAYFDILVKNHKNYIQSK